MRGIVWTGRGFRMVLNGNNRQRLMAHAFDAGVVEIDVRYFDFGRQAVGHYGKAMIVSCNFDARSAPLCDHSMTLINGQNPCVIGRFG